MSKFSVNEEQGLLKVRLETVVPEQLKFQGQTFRFCCEARQIQLSKHHLALQSHILCLPKFVVLHCIPIHQFLFIYSIISPKPCSTVGNNPFRGKEKSMLANQRPFFFFFHNYIQSI